MTKRHGPTGPKRASTQPGRELDQNSITPHLVVSPTYKDPVNGALYVHKDLEMLFPPYEDEDHIGPMKTDVRAGQPGIVGQIREPIRGPGNDVRHVF